MTVPPPDPAAHPDEREDEQSPARRLVEQIRAYEVDPPAPPRARPDVAEDAPGADGA